MWPLSSRGGGVRGLSGQATQKVTFLQLPLQNKDKLCIEAKLCINKEKVRHFNMQKDDGQAKVMTCRQNMQNIQSNKNKCNIKQH